MWIFYSFLFYKHMYKIQIHSFPLHLCPSNAQILRGNDVKTQSTIAMPSSVYEKTINQFGRRQYLILIYIIVHPLLSSSSNDHMRAVVSIDTVMKCFPSNVVHTEFT